MSDKPEWLLRVLKVDVGGAGTGALAAAAATAIPLPPPGKPRPARPGPLRCRAIWQDARDQVDDQFVALQQRLQGTDDADLHSIAQSGLGALTKRLGVRMTVSLIEVEAAAPDKAADARKRMLGVVGEYRKFLNDDKLIASLDANPFGVPMTIGTVLGQALDQIETTLQ